jgi:transposase
MGMARRSFQLTQEQVKGLTYAYTCCKDGPTRTRYQAVRLYGTGYPVKEVVEITGCSRVTLMEWCRKYRTDGISALADQRVGGNRARLSPGQMEELKTRLHLYTPADLFGPTAATAEGQFWTVPDLRRAIQQVSAIKLPVPTCATLILVASATSAQPRCTNPGRKLRWLSSKPS